MKDREVEQFRGIWAAAHLFFSLSSLDWFVTVLSPAFEISTVAKIVLPFLALVSLVHPERRLPFVLMIIAQLTEAISNLPEIPNHRHVVLFMNLGVLIAEVSGSDSSRQMQINRGVGTRLAIVVYFFATLAKLNSDFLSPATSCAAAFYSHVQSIFLFLPSDSSTKTIIILGTILIEGFLVVGLLIPRLRSFTIKLGAIFHILLALDFVKHFVDFSSVMISLLWLFQGLNFIGTRERQVMALAFLVVIATGFLCVTEPSLYILYGAFLFILLVMWIMPLFSRTFSIESLPKLIPAGTLVVILCVISGLGPYVGYKTRAAFNMYSNLMFTNESSNHLFIPRSLDLFGFMKDSVELKDSNKPPLSGLPNNGVKIPRVEILRMAAKNRKFTARFIDKDGEHQIDSALQRQARALPLWVRKFIIFRALGEPTRDQCVW